MRRFRFGIWARPPAARAAPALAALVGFGVLCQCGAETFDLLQQPDGDTSQSMAGGGGTAGSGFAGRDSGNPGGGGTSPCGFAPCPEAGVECPPGAQFCSLCSSALDCAGSPDPFCDPTSHLCVECLDDSACEPGYKCNRITKRCDHACLTGDDCVSPHPLCDPSQGLCVECTGDPHCRAQPSKPYCWVGECVECYDNVGCTQNEVCVSFHCHNR